MENAEIVWTHPEPLVDERHPRRPVCRAGCIEGPCIFRTSMPAVSTAWPSRMRPSFTLAEYVMKEQEKPNHPIRLRTNRDLIDESSEESFPASDPPGWAPLHPGAPCDDEPPRRDPPTRQ